MEMHSITFAVFSWLETNHRSYQHSVGEYGNMSEAEIIGGHR